MTHVEEFSRAVDKFKAAFNANKFDVCKAELTALKIMMTQLPSLLPTGGHGAMAERENLLAREVLEHAVLLSIRLKDEDGFERNFLQLESYYFDKDFLPPSERQQLILGLRLVLLLVQKRTAEFHTELERIPPHVHENDVYVRHAIQLEQWLMEGSYSKVLASKNNLPAADYYTYFIDQLASTVREEIASCCEKAYNTLKVSDAKQLMMLRSTQEMLEYAQQMQELNVKLDNGFGENGNDGGDVVMTENNKSENNVAWCVRNEVIHFKPELHQSTPELSSLEVIKRTLMYARELERIV